MVSPSIVIKLLSILLTIVVIVCLRVQWLQEVRNLQSRRTSTTETTDLVPSSSRSPTVMKRIERRRKPTTKSAKLTTQTFTTVAPLSSNSSAGCNTGKHGYKYDDVVDFRIIVITYSRTKSLVRLLASLDKILLDGHKATLEIWIDVDKNGNANSDTLAAARSFKWTKGVARVHLQSRNAGLIGQWIDTWRPRPDSNEIGLILEDDLIVSPLAFRWLKHVHREMKTQNRVDYAGATLTSQKSLLSPKNTGPIVGPRNDTIVMYKGFGSWGFSPNPEHWRCFQDWFHSHKPSVMPDFHPYVPDCLPTKWYMTAEKNGQAQSIWTIWFIYYMHFKQLFCVYHNLDKFTGKNDTCLSINMKEPGIHFKPGVRYGRPACTLLTQWNERFVVFPKDITRLHWDGTPIGGKGYSL